MGGFCQNAFLYEEYFFLKKIFGHKKTFLHLKSSDLKQKILAFGEYYFSWPI